MILNDRWNGADDPFEGDRELQLRHLPAGALVQRARATVVPVPPSSPPPGQDPFVETIRFSGASGAGDWGATRSTAGTAIEVDFHTRRTLAGLEGSGLAAATLAVDLGGAFVPVGADGALGGPGNFQLQPDGSPALPGLTVVRLRLAGAATAAPEVVAVRVKSAPANLTLSLPGRPALWFHAGELTRPETTPDFTALLQVYLDQKATVEDGFYLLPLVLHSGSIARLAVELEIEYLLRAGVLPDGLRETVLPFAHDGLPRAGAPGLAVTLPADARVVPGAPGVAASRAKGSFDATRVALGPIGDVTPAGTLAVAAGSSPAQPLTIPTGAGELEAVAFDLRLAATTRSARLQLDLREDADGKPGATSLLPAPVTFTLDRASGGATPWTSVALAAPFQFKGARERSGWVVLQALDGEAAWSVVTAAAGTRALQRTTDGGFSWRQAALSPPATAALAGLLRLRSRPAGFSMPIALQVGGGATAQQVSLARFTPLARVDLSLDLPEVAQGLNQALAPAAKAACPVGELLADGDFSRWVRTGVQLGSPHPIFLSGGMEDTFLASRIAAGPDGRQACVVSTRHAAESLLFQALDLGSETVAWQAAASAAAAPVGLAVRSDGTRAYAALVDGSLWILDLAARRALGSPLALSSGNDVTPLAALAFSPDASRVYLAVAAAAVTGDAELREGGLVAYDTAQLEAAVAAGGPAPAPLASASPFPWDPVDLAITPDGSRVFALVQGTGVNAGQADLLAFDFDNLDFDPTLPALFPASGGAPKALALTPDGATAVVLTAGRVSLVRLPGRTVAASFEVPASAAVVAVEPDGAQAFVAGPDGISPIDLARRALVIPSVPAGAVAGLAVTPQGDRILAVVPTAAGVAVIPIGLSIPAEWALTAGTVQRGTLPDGTPIAFLGGLDDPTKAAATGGPSAVSQVVPIAADCTYRLRFQGLATVADAVAELLWRGADGGGVRTDTLPIAVAADLSARTPLVLHRASGAAPAGTTAVEVRFTAPAGASHLTQVSLRADGGALGDLAGGATAWVQIPSLSPAGFALTETAEGTRLRNVSPREVTLSQRVPATAGAAFACELQGRAVAVPGASANVPSPRAELHWQTANGSEVASAILLPVTAASFDAQAAAGTVPAGAEQAEVRLVIPAGAALELRAMDLRFPTPVQLPVTFVAESPGELTLLDWQLTYDRVPAPPLPIPPGGLPPPTPPAQPARGGAPGSSPCPCCGDDRAPVNASPARTPAGRPLTTGTCAGCGATRMDFGGPAPSGTPAAVLPAAAPALPMAALRPRPASPTPLQDLTRVSGIGAARASQLRAIGIDSLRRLATASPTALKRALSGVTETTAGRFVLQARELLKA